MSEELQQIKAAYHEKLARVKLIEAGVSVDDVDKYIKYVNVENADEIGEQARNIAADVKREPIGADPKVNRVWSPFK